METKNTASFDLAVLVFELDMFYCLFLRIRKKLYDVKYIWIVMDIA